MPAGKNDLSAAAFELTFAMLVYLFDVPDYDVGMGFDNRVRY